MDTEVQTTPMAMPNMALVFKILDKIAEDETKWDQMTWVDSDIDEIPEDFNLCSTTKCFGGWACSLAGHVKVLTGVDGYIIPIDDNGFKSNWFVEACRVLGFN